MMPCIDHSPPVPAFVRRFDTLVSSGLLARLSGRALKVLAALGLAATPLTTGSRTRTLDDSQGSRHRRPGALPILNLRKKISRCPHPAGDLLPPRAAPLLQRGHCASRIGPVNWAVQPGGEKKNARAAFLCASVSGSDGHGPIM